MSGQFGMQPTRRTLSRTGIAVVSSSLILWWVWYHLLMVVTILFTCIVTLAAYRLTLHPLASVPGPRIAALSNVWYAYHAKNGLVAQLAKTLHEKYGPVVRVGPNEVWFNSKAAFKAIYGNGSGYEKSDFYLATALTKPKLDWLMRPHTEDTLDLLSERDMRRYRQQRRLIGPVYRPANVAKYEPAVHAVLRRVVAKLKELDGAEVDLKEWMHITVVECLGAAVLSWSPGMVKQGTDWSTSKHSYMAWRRKSVLGLFPFIAKLEMCSKALGRAFSVAWGLTYKTPKDFRAWFPVVARHTAKRAKAAQRGSMWDDLAGDLIRLHQEKPEFTEAYLRKMIVTNFGAGHETMASTLTSLMAMIGTHRDVQGRLAEEVRQNHAYPHNPLDQDHLSYLHAVLKESKRLHPVVAMSLPRSVPAAGLTLHGYFFAAGTTVGCSPIALQRNEEICGPGPSTFNPDRWQDEKRARDMEMYSLSWGGGARSCPGRHLAEMLVWNICITIIAEFDIEVVKVPTEDEMPTYFLSMMAGVKARFIPIAKDQSVRERTLHNERGEKMHYH